MSRKSLSLRVRRGRNPYVETVIGSIRREYLDHLVVSNERHLRRVLSSYADYCHHARTHLSLDKDCPLVALCILCATKPTIAPKSRLFLGCETRESQRPRDSKGGDERPPASRSCSPSDRTEPDRASARGGLFLPRRHLAFLALPSRAPALCASVAICRATNGRKWMGVDHMGFIFFQDFLARIALPTRKVPAFWTVSLDTFHHSAHGLAIAKSEHHSSVLVGSGSSILPPKTEHARGRLQRPKTEAPPSLQAPATSPLCANNDRLDVIANHSIEDRRPSKRRSRTHRQCAAR